MRRPALIRAAVSVGSELAEELRARFVELAPGGFEERELPGGIELAAYGEAAGRILEAFPGASRSELADGWEDAWRVFHRPVVVGPLWVGPPWLEPPAGLDPVVIDPGRAFGTGAHATTRLCLELLLGRLRGSLLDLGCGSGVIAIAAVRLGFAPVVALDIDPVAVEVARGNAQVNGVEIEVGEADVASAELPPASLAVVNIALGPLAGLGERLRVGTVVASGYRSEERPQLAGFRALARRELDGWAADLFVRG